MIGEIISGLFAGLVGYFVGVARGSDAARIQTNQDSNAKYDSLREQYRTEKEKAEARENELGPERCRVETNGGGDRIR